MKKKNLIVATAFALSSVGAMAGGLLTNSNQNAAFLRQMSQAGVIDITGLYLNPAGTAFLSKGWHLSLNNQTAIQERQINTMFPLFALNQNNPEASHSFLGEAKAPVIPSLHLSYNQDKWSVNASIALVGGGGKCEFDQGLGSFETLYSGQLYQLIPSAVSQMVGAQVGAALPGQVQQKVAAGLVGAGIPETYANALAATTETTYGVNSQMTGYSLNSYMKGRSYYFGLQVGGTYKFTDNLAGFVGVRGVYATCNYNGYVQDVKAGYAYQVNYSYNTPANAQLGFPGTSGEGQLTGEGTQDLSSNGLSLNCDQTGFGITPIIGVDYKVNEKWNVAAKYEAPTRMNLKNKTEMNDYAKAQVASGNATLGQFADGTKVREDIPGILTLGAQYRPVEPLRLNAGYHVYFDKSAKKYGDKQELIDHNTWELNAGVEYDICKLVTVSGSWQTTQYGLSDQYMNDLSFNLSNHMVGLGVRINATERCSIDLGYMHTFYGERTVETNLSPTLVKTDVYNRKNDVVGVGVNLHF